MCLLEFISPNATFYARLCSFRRRVAEILHNQIPRQPPFCAQLGVVEERGSHKACPRMIHGAKHGTITSVRFPLNLIQSNVRFRCPFLVSRVCFICS